MSQPPSRGQAFLRAVEAALGVGWRWENREGGGLGEWEGWKPNSGVSCGAVL